MIAVLKLQANERTNKNEMIAQKAKDYIPYLIIIVFILMIRLSSSLNGVLIEHDLISDYWVYGVRMFTKSIMVLILLLIVHRQGYIWFNFSNTYIEKWNVTAFRALLLIIFVLLYILVSYSSKGAIGLVLIILSTYLSALTEEITFRGLVLPILLKKEKNSLIKPVLVSSVLFGLIHFMNLINEPDNQIGITFQVIVATMLGIVFCYVMLRIRNIVIVGLLHGSINLLFGQGSIFNYQKFLEQTNKEYSADWLSSAFTISLFILIGYIYLKKIQKLEKEEIINEFNDHKQKKATLGLPI